MKEPKQIALKWCELLQNMQELDRVELVFTLIREKDNLKMQEFRQLCECGIPVIDSLRGLCQKDISEIANWYELLTDALERYYMKRTGQISTWKDEPIEIK